MVPFAPLSVNSIRNVFPKDTAEWLHWIEQGKLLYVDKERIQDLINQQRMNLADVEYLDLDRVDIILKEFENPQEGKSNFHKATTTTATSFMDDKRSRGEILEEKLVDSTAPIKFV